MPQAETTAETVSRSRQEDQLDQQLSSVSSSTPSTSAVSRQSSQLEITEEITLCNDHEIEPAPEYSELEDSYVLSVSVTLQKQTKRSTFQRHPWIVTISGGYMCGTCRDYASASGKSAGGKWVSIPVSKTVSDKLYKKVDKHARSQLHRFAIACKSGQTGQPDSCQLFEAANKKAESNTDMLKKMFRLAYFLFKQEIPHTTNWRALVSSASACDNSGQLTKYLKKTPLLMVIIYLQIQYWECWKHMVHPFTVT